MNRKLSFNQILPIILSSYLYMPFYVDIDIVKKTILCCRNSFTHFNKFKHCRFIGARICCLIAECSSMCRIKIGLLHDDRMRWWTIQCYQRLKRNTETNWIEWKQVRKTRYKVSSSEFIFKWVRPQNNCLSEFLTFKYLNFFNSNNFIQKLNWIINYSKQTPNQIKAQLVFFVIIYQMLRLSVLLNT